MINNGQISIVTGGGGEGSGRAISRRLAREGSFVVVADIDVAAGQETVDIIKGENGHAAFLEADVGREVDVRKLVAFAEAQGDIEIIVNNASYLHQADALEKWFETVQTDLIGPMHMMHFGIEVMRQRHRGAIVNISSTSAL